MPNWISEPASGEDTAAGNLPEPADTRRRSVGLVAVRELVLDGSPRSTGADPEHVARLAEIDPAVLPPVVVDAATRRVIDGTHRLLAARARGDECIPVQWFRGSEREAWALAVEANVTHGLPLSQQDRKSAAARLLEEFPEWSDRTVARRCGIAPGTVAKIRRSTDQAGQSNGATRRVGADGRTRPANSGESRQKALDILTRRPQSSLREVAREAGVSIATASAARREYGVRADTANDERAPMGGGQEPHGVAPPPGAEPSLADEAPEKDALEQRHAPGSPASVPRRRDGCARQPEQKLPAVDAILEQLRRDPAVRSRQEARALMRLIDAHNSVMREWRTLFRQLPEYQMSNFSVLLRSLGETWIEIACSLEDGSL